MKRREFLRSVGMAPVVAVGALAGVKASAVYEELPMPKHYGMPVLADHLRTLERYSATLKVPYAAIVDPV